MSTSLKELTILSRINGNINIYTLRNREALLSPYGNPLTLQDLYKPQKTFTNSTQNYYSPISQKLKFKGGVLLRDTSIIPYTRPPVSTNAARRDRPRDDNLMAICRILPYSAKSTKSCQVLLGPLLESYSAPCTCRLSNQTNNIYPFFPFPYLLSLCNVLILSHSLYTQLNNIYFAIYYHHLYSLRDNKALEYFIIIKALTAQQVRQADILSQFNFLIIYRLGAINCADTLIRRKQDLGNQAAVKILLQTQILL